MSVKLINHAYKQQGLPPGEKAVLLALCDCYNDKTGQCNPSQKTLGKKTGYSRRTVNTHLSRLENKKIIRRIRRRRDDGGNGTCAYKITLPTDEKETHMGRGNIAHPPCEEVAQEIYKPEVLETEDLTPVAPQTNLDTEFEEFWLNVWKPFDMAKGSKKLASKKFIQHRKKGISYENIKTGGEKYINFCHGTECRTKHVCTWLSQHGWEDEYPNDKQIVSKNKLGRSKGYSPTDALALALADQTRQ